MGQRAGTESATAKEPAMRVFLGSRSQLRKVRAFITEALDSDCPAIDDVVLLANEIATNAIVHTASGKGGTFTILTRPSASAILVEVHDGGSDNVPYTHEAGKRDESGRGLGLVDGLATRWGHLGGRDGRVVWFEVTW